MLSFFETAFAILLSSYGGRVVLEREQKGNEVEFTGENCEFICRSNSLKQYKVDVQNSKFECYANALESIQIIAKGNSQIKTKSALQMTMNREPTTKFNALN